MARLVCPYCKTTHRVSVLQSAYRELPCKSCSRPIPLTLAETSSTALPAAPPSSDLSVEDAAVAELAAAAAATDSESTPEPTALARVEDQTAMAWDERIQLPPAAQVSTLPMASPAARAAGTTSGGTVEAAPGSVTNGPSCPRCRSSLQPGAIKCPRCKQFLPGSAAQLPSLTRALLWAIAIAAVAVAVLLTLLYLRAPRTI